MCHTTVIASHRLEPSEGDTKIMRKIAAPLFAATAFMLAAPAQADDTQYWQTVTVNVALPDNFKVQNETVFRSGDARGFYELENNLMIGKKLNKTVTVWLGYTFDPNYNHGTLTVREHRFRQQVSFDNFLVVGKVKFSGRLRLEERWREGQPGTAWRLRPQVKASMPLTGKATIAISSEQFIDLNNTGFQTVDGLQRMRNAVSVTVPLSKKVNMDFGYLRQHNYVPNGPDSDDNVLTLGLSASF